MRTSGAVQCPACDATWTAGAARFCGDCGEALAPTTTRTPEVSGSWTRLAVGLAAAIVVIGGAFAVGGGSAFRLPARSVVPAVEVDPEAVPLEGEPLSDAARAEALAPFDPDRLRCEPEGCERWRVDVPSSPTGMLHGAVAGDLVVTATRGEVHAYDLDTGAPQWQTAWPDTADPPTSSDLAFVQAVDEARIVVTWPRSGHAMALDPQGAPLWHLHEPMPASGNLSTWEDDVVVVSRSSGEEIAGPGQANAYWTLEDIRALDPLTGAALWEEASITIRAVAPGRMIVHDGQTARVLESRTGDELGRRALPITTLFRPFDGGVLAREVDRGPWQLLDLDSLEVVAELGRFDRIQPSLDGSVLVGLRRGEDDTGDTIEVFEPDGTPRWQHELSFPAGSLAVCCATPEVDGDDLVLTPAAGTPAPLRFDLSDGTRLEASPAGPGSAPRPGPVLGTVDRPRDRRHLEPRRVEWHDPGLARGLPRWPAWRHVQRSPQHATAAGVHQRREHRRGPAGSTGLIAPYDGAVSRDARRGGRTCDATGR